MTFIRPRRTAASIPSHNCTPVTRTIVLIVCAIARPGRTRLLSHGTSSTSPMVRSFNQNKAAHNFAPHRSHFVRAGCDRQYVRAGSPLLRKTAVHTDPKIGPVLTFENAIAVPRAKLFLIKMGVLHLIAVALFIASLLAGKLRGAIALVAQPNLTIQRLGVCFPRVAKMASISYRSTAAMRMRFRCLM